MEKIKTDSSKSIQSYNTLQVIYVAVILYNHVTVTYKCWKGRMYVNIAYILAVREKDKPSPN